MKYTDIKTNFEAPNIWRKPSSHKIPHNGKPYMEYAKEILDFDTLKENAKKELSTTISNNIDLSVSKNELNQRLSELFEFYGKAIIPTDDLDPEFLLAKTNKNTLNKKLQGWCKNLSYNVSQIRLAKPYNDLVGKFEGVPAFVVLAGPSLKNNREQLKEAKGKSIIIAVDTSLRPLLDVGVVPDIVVTHDANPNGCKFFLSEDHPFNKTNLQLNDMDEQQLAFVYAQMLKDKKRLEYKYDTLGLFVNYCHPMTLLSFNGREKRYYAVYDPSLPVYDVMARATNYNAQGNLYSEEEKGRIIGGSSVGHVAAYVAVAMKCDPVSFIGLDLSYPGGKTYIDGASNQKDASKQRLVEVEDLSGNKVGTNLSMLSYKMVLERTLPSIITQTRLGFYNCTEDSNGKPAGILEVGAEPKSLEWVIKNKCKKEINFKEVLT